MTRKSAIGYEWLLFSLFRGLCIYCVLVRKLKPHSFFSGVWLRGYGAPYTPKLCISLQTVASKIKTGLCLLSKQRNTVKEQVNLEVQLHGFVTQLIT